MRHIRETMRAFPVADLAKALLRGRDRYQVRFRSEEGGPSLYRCKGESSLWLGREEAINEALRAGGLEKYYDVEEVEVDPPTGNFSAIAVCGMSGEILGPPNHHEYQRNVARLHAERFANMPLERFKSRIVMESGEEAVEKWKEEVSRKLHFRVRSADDDKAENTAGGAGAAEASPAGEEDENSEKSGANESDTSGSDSTGTDTGGAAESEEASGESAAAGEDCGSSESEADPDATGAAEVGTSGGDEPAVVENPAEAEPAGEEAGESGEADEPDAEETPSDEVDPPEEGDSPGAPPEDNRPVIESREELARHFRTHFADDAIEELREAVVPGDIPGEALSRGLLAHLKKETEALRRGFPLPMVQALCREFEKRGMRFFKRGKKALHVSVVRPRAIDEAVSFTDQIQAIVDEIVKRNGLQVVDLLDALADDFTKPPKDAASESLELTEQARSVLTDLRWLTSEGFVIELPDTRLFLGKQSKGKTAPKKQTTAKSKQGAPERAAADGSESPAGATKSEADSRPEEAPGTGPSASSESDSSDPKSSSEATSTEPDSESGEEKEPSSETGNVSEGEAPTSSTEEAPDPAAEADPKPGSGKGEDESDAPEAAAEEGGAAATEPPSGEESPRSSD